jgi:hypothetical protein
MALESDDEQTVYATSRGAVIVSCDREFSQRRRRNAIGRHLYLKCPKPDAAEVLRCHLDAVISLLQKADITVTITQDTVTAAYAWD